jgi:hypothetical protein
LSADGVRIVLKAMGKEPFPGGRSSTFETIASEQQIAECRWGYQCSVCLLAGDLLCCEVGGSKKRAHLWHNLGVALSSCLGRVQSKLDKTPAATWRTLALPLACSIPTAVA